MGSADFGRFDICSRSGGLISAQLQTGTPDFSSLAFGVSLKVECWSLELVPIAP